MDLPTPMRSPNSASPLHTQKQCTVRASSGALPSLTLTTTGVRITCGGSQACRQPSATDYILVLNRLIDKFPQVTVARLYVEVVVCVSFRVCERVAQKLLSAIAIKHSNRTQINIAATTRQTLRPTRLYYT